MTEQLDLFEWAAQHPRPEAVLIEAVPYLLKKIRIEQAYRIPRPSGGAKVLQLQRRAA